MFKSKIRLVNQKWDELYSYKTRIKPNIGEFIYVDNHKCYYKVINILHSTKYGEIILVVEKIENYNKKDLQLN